MEKEYTDEEVVVENSVSGMTIEKLEELRKALLEYSLTKAKVNPRYKSVGRFYMTKPFATRAVETKVLGRLAEFTQTTHLTELEILADYPDKNARVGDKLLVRGETLNTPWAKQVLKTGDLEFILVPEEYAVLLLKG